MPKYELGGVTFIIHDGEVYCRYKDVYEPSSMVEELGESEEEPDLEVEIKTHERKAKQAKTSKRACGICGSAMHNKRTCPEAKTDYQRSEPEPETPLEDRVQNLVHEGCSLDEVLLTFPLESAAKLVELYNKSKGTRVMID